MEVGCPLIFHSDAEQTLLSMMTETVGSQLGKGDSPSPDSTGIDSLGLLGEKKRSWTIRASELFPDRRA